MFQRQLTTHGHVWRFTVQQGIFSGWDLREERDEAVIRETHHNDWHRVEWEVRLFQEAAELERTVRTQHRAVQAA
jgi:hypothetical protein